MGNELKKLKSRHIDGCNYQTKLSWLEILLMQDCRYYTMMLRTVEERCQIDIKFYFGGWEMSFRT